jgi:hypothetical protein
MATHDYIISNASGAAVRADLNNALAAIATNNSSATEPTTTYAYQWWADTGSSPTVMKLRNAANSAWITLFQLDGEWSLIPFENGTAAAPSIYFKDSGTDTGFYSPGANQVGISTGGTARLTIDSNGNVDIDSNTLYVDATNNRVGLGVSDPGQKLVIGGGTNGRTRIKVDSGSGNFGKFEFSTDSALTTSAVQVAEITANITGTGPLTSSLQFATNSGNSLNTAMTIDSSQRVGIGTTSPARQLDVNSTAIFDSNGNGSTTSPSIAIGSTGTGLSYIGSQQLAFLTNSAERARIDSSGRLLVGTSTGRNGGYADPAQVQIEGLSYNSAAQSIIIDSNDGNGPSLNFGKSRGTSLNSNTVVQSGDRLGVIDFAGADGTSLKRGAVIEAYVDGTPGASDMPGRLVFSTTADGASSPTERMRINNGGGVMIGTTNAQTGIGDLTTVTGVAFSPDGWVGGCRSSEAAGYFTRTGTDGRVINFYKGSTGVGGISVTTTATAFNTSSDYRLKENIISISNAIERVKQLNPCRFNFIANPEQTVDGFIAHEAQQVVPEAVEGTKDEVDENGKPIYQGIDQSKLVPLLTAALQEALAEIESLKARVTALEP